MQADLWPQPRQETFTNHDAAANVDWLLILSRRVHLTQRCDSNCSKADCDFSFGTGKVASVKQIFRNTAHRDENTESVLKTLNSHNTQGLAYNSSPRRSINRVSPGSLSFFYGRNAKKLTPDDERSTSGVFRFYPTFWAFSASVTLDRNISVRKERYRAATETRAVPSGTPDLY